MSRSTRRKILRLEGGFLIFVFGAACQPQRLAELIGALAIEVEGREPLALETQELANGLLEATQIPLLGVDVRSAVRLDLLVDQSLGQRHQIVARVDLVFFGVGGVVFEVDRALEQLPAQRVDVLPLLVHNIVVLEQVFSDGEVLGLDLLLCALDRPGDHLVLDWHAFLHPQSLHEAGDPIGPEDPASGRLRATGRTERSQGHPGGRRGRAADCRFAAPRVARSR